MTAPRLVAIDGGAGSGKSTLARSLARALRLPYVNTGLMYRALTLESLEHGVEARDGDALAALTRTLRFGLDEGNPPELSIQGVAPRLELQSMAVEQNVSVVSSHPQVRVLMQATQRRLAARGAVMEGRDMGSVVVPEALFKLYLTADARSRAERRARERASAGSPATPSEVAGELQRRDARDTRVTPLAPLDDAIVLDTSALDLRATLDVALDLIRTHAPELLP